MYKRQIYNFTGNDVDTLGKINTPFMPLITEGVLDKEISGHRNSATDLDLAQKPKSKFTLPDPIHTYSSENSLSNPPKLSTEDVVRKLSPSIVQITSERANIAAFNQVIPSNGVGTGVIFDKSGHILTNNHVIIGAEVINVTLSTGNHYIASIVGTDMITDTAVISIEACLLYTSPSPRD